ncbi:MAG: circadian clock protein KaiA [Leptolyngbyaceae cyanobacterium bins.302]|nr:circadian clock protein KaiA [Leptolyngbyaceae cyanobacterium bins.302]
MDSPLSVCTFFNLDSLAQLASKALGSDERYRLYQHSSLEALYAFLEKEKHDLDCLVLQNTPDLGKLTTWLYGHATLLPAVVVAIPGDPLLLETAPESFRYHRAEVIIQPAELTQIYQYVDQAIAQFVNLSPTSWSKFDPSSPQAQNSPSSSDLLLPQQQRLTEKLKERLGYLGVYYKRDPQNFFRHLSAEQKQELLDTLRATYQEIILRYFSDDGTLNQRIDDFVNTVFFTDVSAAQVVEIHMELIDEFSKQLKLEGRSEEILLDYRLTLIDTIAHLCEMYRRSIPRET